VSTTVAGYDVVTDGQVCLGAGAGEDPDHDFTLGFNPALAAGIRSVLSYMVYPGSAGVTYTMEINPNDPTKNQVVSATLSPGGGYVRQEVIDGNMLTSTGKSLHIKVSQGSACCSDIVVMHQSTVP
jgi:hypothetical protein